MVTLKRMGADGKWEYIQLTGEDVTTLIGDVNGVKTQSVTYQSDLNGRGVNVKYPPTPYVAAKGDWNGTTGTNDTTAIQNIINAFDKIYIPDGTYKVTNLTVPSNKAIIGQSMYKTILYSSSSGYIFSTVDKAYFSTISTMTLQSNWTSSGIHVVCSSNTGLTQYDISINIENIYINNFDYGIYLDASARGCRVNNVRAYYGRNAFYITGTDNFIDNCTCGSLNYKGFYVGANNKVDTCKAFMCGAIAGDHAFHITDYNNLTNICAQQNYGAGLYVEGDSNYVDIVSDSNGFNNAFINSAFGIFVNGRFNMIRGTVVDGRLNGNLKSALNFTNNGILNSVNITFKVIENKPVYNNDSFPIISFFQNHLNDVVINGSSVMKISDIVFTQLKDVAYTTQLDNSSGSVTLVGNEFQINMTNYQSTSANWGNTARFNIIPLNTTNKKYLIVKGQVKVSGDTYAYSQAAMGGTGGQAIGTARLVTNPQIISRQYVDFYCAYDLTLLATQQADSRLWLGLFKNTSSAVGVSTTAYFKDVKFYFTD